MTETTAAALIRESLCTPACLVAGEGEAVKCSCRCSGAYHARLAAIRVELAPDQPAPAPRVFPGQMTIDEVLALVD